MARKEQVQGEGNNNDEGHLGYGLQQHIVAAGIAWLFIVEHAFYGCRLVVRLNLQLDHGVDCQRGKPQHRDFKHGIEPAEIYKQHVDNIFAAAQLIAVLGIEA
ncbi:hypothetical protein D3C80_2014210 [compost metagenome]